METERAKRKMGVPTKAELRATITRVEKDNERLRKNLERLRLGKQAHDLALDRLENEKRMRTEACERAQRLTNEHDKAVEAYEQRHHVVIQAMERRANEVIEGLQLKIYDLEHGHSPKTTIGDLAADLMWATDEQIETLKKEDNDRLHEEDRRWQQMHGGQDR